MGGRAAGLRKMKPNNWVELRKPFSEELEDFALGCEALLLDIENETNRLDRQQKLVMTFDLLNLMHHRVREAFRMSEG